MHAQLKNVIPLPTFETAQNRRQKVRAAGLDPNYWYPVEYDSAVKTGAVVEVKFWKRSYALFRGEDGVLRAVENRCAHRQLKLTLGNVTGCHLVCGYHGWAYDGDGCVAHIPHDLFGKTMPKVQIASFPVKVRYGLIWMFFGRPELAETRGIPDIPELQGPDRWSFVPVDFVWKAHHSMIIDNVSDFTHAYLHRKYAPFTDAKLTLCETRGDAVHVTYDTKVGGGPIYKYFIDHKTTNTNAIELCYEYPFQWSNTGDKIKHHCFVLPIDEHTTRSFFLFYFRGFRFPFSPVEIPQWLMDPFLRLGNRMLMKPLLEQDGVAVEAEQLGYNDHFREPLVELSPAVHAFQTLTIRKWEEYLKAA
jgi:phenylpropionate dioxygenase-like ring-hydroxylating dioxygenase large terminal subunit